MQSFDGGRPSISNKKKSLIHQLKLLPRCVWHAGWLLNQQFGHSASFNANTTVEYV